MTLLNRSLIRSQASQVKANETRHTNDNMDRQISIIQNYLTTIETMDTQALQDFNVSDFPIAFLFYLCL